MVAPVSIEVHTVLAATPDAVWQHLVDWERLGRWMRELRRVRVTSPHREGVGVEAIGTVRVAGITTTDRIRVTRWEPPHLLEIAHLGWVKGTAIMRLDARDGGTALRWRETLAPPWGPLGAIGLRAFRPLLRRIFARDLRLLRQLIDRGP